MDCDSMEIEGINFDIGPVDEIRFVKSRKKMDLFEYGPIYPKCFGGMMQGLFNKSGYSVEVLGEMFGLLAFVPHMYPEHPSFQASCVASNSIEAKDLNFRPRWFQARGICLPAPRKNIREGIPKSRFLF